MYYSSSYPPLSGLTSGGIIIVGELHQISLDKTIYLAIHDGIDIRSLIARAVILHSAVIKDIASNLTAPLYLLLAGFNLGLLGLFLLQRPVIELTLEQEHSLSAVLRLVTSLCILNKNLLMLTGVRVFILIAEPHARFHLVDILATCTA